MKDKPEFIISFILILFVFLGSVFYISWLIIGKTGSLTEIEYAPKVISPQSKGQITIAQNNNKTEIKINAPNEIISAVAIRIKYPAKVAPSLVINEKIIQDNWSFPVNTVEYDDESAEYHLDLAAINLSPGGFLVEDELVLAYLELPKGASGELLFDPEFTKVINKAGVELILQFNGVTIKGM